VAISLGNAKARGNIETPSSHIVKLKQVRRMHDLIIAGGLLRQREEWIRFSYSNEDTKDGEERAARCGAKRQAHTLSQDNATTPAQLTDSLYEMLTVPILRSYNTRC
jgi:hypothetical protein